MATKKKAGKAAGTKKTTKLVRKSKSLSSKTSQAKKTVTKPKSSKGKKPAAQKKSKPKSGKSATTAKKTKPATASKKKKASKPSAGTIKKPAASKEKVQKKPAPSKPATVKKTTTPKSPVPRQTKTSATGLTGLSPQERYNVGGLCACIIETSTKEGQDQLERVLKHLNLSEMDQSNLIRVSQGLRIPKLFADGLVGTETRKSVLEGLAQFAKTDDPSGKTWKTELEDFGRLLGD